MNVFDPYAACEIECTHDLAPGVGTDELLQGDGPYLPAEVIRWPTVELATAVEAAAA